VAGTAVGVFAGDAIGNPETFGLDVLFPAFFLALLVGELRAGKSAIAAAAIGVALALALIPFAPPGVPVIAASAGALLGLSSRVHPGGIDRDPLIEAEEGP
jgi:predicted branched-subunit amino acid permease